MSADDMAPELIGPDGRLAVRVLFDMNSEMNSPERRREVLTRCVFQEVPRERWEFHAQPIADVVWYAARVTPEEVAMLRSALVCDGVRMVVE